MEVRAGTSPKRFVVRAQTNFLQFQSMKLDLTAIEPCILKGLTIIHLPDLLLFLVLTLIFLYPLPRNPFR